ncbi:MAG: hypothetical protein ACE5HB_09675, partial [Terriglobia bacterium]
MRVRTPLTLLALLLVLAAGLQAKKKDNWVELRSSHFHIVTNAKPKKAEQVAHQLEEFRHLLGLFFPFLQLDPPAPARVLLFKNKKSFRPYQPLTPEGKPDKASGFMQPGRERMFLAVDLGTRHATQTAYHEYIHLLLRLNFADLPVWLNEGMAEFYEHTEIDGKDFKLGDWSPGWWRVLRQRGLLPVEAMANADHRSSYYNVPKRRQ